MGAGGLRREGGWEKERRPLGLGTPAAFTEGIGRFCGVRQRWGVWGLWFASTRIGVSGGCVCKRTKWLRWCYSEWEGEGRQQRVKAFPSLCMHHQKCVVLWHWK